MSKRKTGYNYSSFSGADMIAELSFSGDKINGSYRFGELTTLSYSFNTIVKPIRPLSKKDVIGYTNGPRTFAGSLVFSVFDKYIGNRILEEISPELNNQTILMDELPPFNITISMGNEYDQRASVAILGVQIVNEGQVMSVNDITTENTYQFVATSVIPLTDYLNSKEGRDNTVETRVTEESKNIKSFQYNKNDFIAPQKQGEQERLYVAKDSDGILKINLANKNNDKDYLIEIHKKDTDENVLTTFYGQETDSHVTFPLSLPEGEYYCFYMSSHTGDFEDETFNSSDKIYFNVKREKLEEFKVSPPQDIYIESLDNLIHIYDYSDKKTLDIYDENGIFIKNIIKSEDKFIIKDLPEDIDVFAIKNEFAEDGYIYIYCGDNNVNNDILFCKKILLGNFYKINNIININTLEDYTLLVNSITNKMVELRNLSTHSSVSELFLKVLLYFKAISLESKEYLICSLLFNTVNRGYRKSIVKRNIIDKETNDLNITDDGYISNIDKTHNLIIRNPITKEEIYTQEQDDLLSVDNDTLHDIFILNDFDNKRLPHSFFKPAQEILSKISINKEKNINTLNNTKNNMISNYSGFSTMEELDKNLMLLFQSHKYMESTKYIPPCIFKYDNYSLYPILHDRYRSLNLNSLNICIQELQSYLKNEPCYIIEKYDDSIYIPLNENLIYVGWLQNEENEILNIPNIIKYNDSDVDYFYTFVFNEIIENIKESAINVFKDKEPYLIEEISNLIDYQDMSVVDAIDIIINRLNINFIKVNDLQKVNTFLIAKKREILGFTNRANISSFFETVSMKSIDSHIKKIIFSNANESGDLSIIEMSKQDKNVTKNLIVKRCEPGETYEFEIDIRSNPGYSGLTTIRFISENFLKQSKVLAYDKALKLLYET